MLLRDRLLDRLRTMGDEPDYQRLCADVLGVRNAPPDLARRLVSQALVVEDRQEDWAELGRRAAAAPQRPGVYVLRDAAGLPLYVGKANNLRRRLRAHFSPRRWAALPPAFTRAVSVEWQEVGSEVEALLREADLIARLAPAVNVQTGGPALATRAVPAALTRDVIVVAPSVEVDSAELVAARADGAWRLQRTRLNGADLAVHGRRLMRFFHSALRERFAGERLAPLVFSWLAGRGASASRIDPADCRSASDLAVRLRSLLADERLFDERIVVIDSKIPASARRAPGVHRRGKQSHA